jgi:serine/threonine-protein kinase
VLVALLVLAAGAVAAVALSGVLGGGGGNGNTTSTKTNATVTYTHVPGDLLKQTAEAAEGELDNANLKHVRVQRQTLAVTAGLVIGTQPTGGARVRKGSTVTLFISQAPPTVKVPPIKGLSIGDAKTALSAVGLTAKETDVDSTEPQGTVVDSTPADGATAKTGSTVDVNVSKGPQPVNVPDVSNFDLDHAESALKNQNLVVGHIDHEPSSTVASGEVIRTAPAADTPAHEGDSVGIVLSNGLRKIPTPNVIGETPDNAQTDIQKAGLTPQISTVPIQVTDPAQDGVVVKTSPSADTPAREGSKVIVRVGQYSGGTDTTTTDTTVTDTTSTDTTGGSVSQGQNGQ